MQKHELKRKTKNKKTVLVGRGGKRGKTCGRGGKGQTARAGHKIRPEMRDLIKKLPKLRGYAFKSFQSDYAIVNVGDLDKTFSNGETVNPKSLVERGVFKIKLGKNPIVKILAGGEISKKVIVLNCKISKEARTKIEKAGGEIK